MKTVLCSLYSFELVEESTASNAFLSNPNRRDPYMELDLVQCTSVFSVCALGLSVFSPVWKNVNVFVGDFPL